jgi:UDP:flavonoid glycosyltransferase YjiC (YdhE family)
VINHGGPGTFFTTLLHGVPQLVLYQGMFDDRFIGRYAHNQGAGLAMPMAEVTGARVREAVRRLLAEPAFRANAGRLRREVEDMPTPNQLVPELERLTVKYR